VWGGLTIEQNVSKTISSFLLSPSINDGLPLDLEALREQPVAHSKWFGQENRLRHAAMMNT
jgi:hypothetical protein